MKTFALITIALCVGATLAGGCYKPANFESPHSWVDPMPETSYEQLPDSFTWGDNNGKNYLTQMKNQHIPNYCGSCWAQGSTSALSDRISIMRNAAFPEINVNVQQILDCDTDDDGCHGGNHLSAYRWIEQNGITDETCSPYLALSYVEGRKCTDESVCKECAPGGAGCHVPKQYNTYKISKYGSVSGEENMMKEIMQNGPIACGVDARPIEGLTSWDIVKTPGAGIDHIVSVVGWGVENGQKFWYMRNSWGEYFGKEGYARIARGNGGAINIEEDCAWATPIDTWSNQPYPHAAKEKSEGEKVAEKTESLVDGLLNSMFTPKGKYIPGLLPDEQNPWKLDLPDEVVTGPRPEDYMTNGDIPASFWWGDVNGVNYLSWTVNQHVPQYCGSCWAQGAQSAFADRVNIQTENKFPRMAMSVQQILNCAAGGTCQGGSLNGVYQFGHKHYLVEFGCQIYEAKDPASADCSPIQNCANCHWGSHFSNICEPITDNFRQWYAGQYGRVQGKNAMQKEIYARGPITCGMHVTNNFYNNYTGGVYSENIPSTGANHAVSVVGWGTDAKDGDYWIVRNSWGTWWGESGYFRITMGRGNLGIGVNSCYWAVPTTTKP